MTACSIDRVGRSPSRSACLGKRNVCGTCAPGSVQEKKPGCWHPGSKTVKRQSYLNRYSVPFGKRIGPLPVPLTGLLTVVAPELA